MRCCCMAWQPCRHTRHAYEPFDDLDAPDEEYGYKKSHSGYAALRRSMTKEEVKLAGDKMLEDKGLSDIVMVSSLGNVHNRKFACISAM